MTSAPPPRTADQRKADTLATLLTPEIDVWVASVGRADDGPEAHLVPLSFAWIDDRAVIAVATASVTARNITRSGRARLALGRTRDVVMIDAVLEEAVAVEQAPPPIADGYANQADWDPRGDEGYSYLTLRPTRIQAWREANEIRGRTLMRDGSWIA